MVVHFFLQKKIFPTRTLPSEATFKRSVETNVCSWMKSALCTFNFSIKLSHMIASKSNMIMTSNILMAKFVPGDSLSIFRTLFSFHSQDRSMNWALLLQYPEAEGSEGFNKLPEISKKLRGRQAGSDLMLTFQSPFSYPFPTATPQKNYRIYLSVGNAHFRLKRECLCHLLQRETVL